MLYSLFISSACPSTEQVHNEMEIRMRESLRILHGRKKGSIRAGRKTAEPLQASFQNFGQRGLHALLFLAFAFLSFDAPKSLSHFLDSSSETGSIRDGIGA